RLERGKGGGRLDGTPPRTAGGVEAGSGIGRGGGVSITAAAQSPWSEGARGGSATGAGGSTDGGAGARPGPPSARPPPPRAGRARPARARSRVRVQVERALPRRRLLLDLGLQRRLGLQGVRARAHRLARLQRRDGELLDVLLILLPEHPRAMDADRPVVAG